MITAPENFLHQALSFLQSAGLYGHLSMVQLTNDPFLNELNKMYERNKDKGTVWVTLKRSAFPNCPTPLSRAPPRSAPPRRWRSLQSGACLLPLQPLSYAHTSRCTAGTLKSRRARQADPVRCGPVHFAELPCSAVFAQCTHNTL